MRISKLHIQKYKKPVIWITVLAELLCLWGMAACMSGVENIEGYYQYEKTIYQNPASSYFVTKENADDYIISNNSITILHHDGTKEEISASFEKSEVDMEAFSGLFIPEFGMPDISGFKQRRQYSINEQYNLYMMDDQIWLAMCPKNTMWGIYRLAKI